jgi:hypothetical protein
MKLKFILTAFLLNIWVAFGQGTFVYDQQSTNLIEGAAGLQSGQPMGQSFTPTLSSVGLSRNNGKISVLITHINFPPPYNPAMT